MKIKNAKYTCANCGEEFHAPFLGDFAYGEFLLWSRDGNVAYLNVFKDSTYQELIDLISNHKNTLLISENRRIEMLQVIYGSLTCDMSNKGFSYEIGHNPPCPSCSSQNMMAWNLAEDNDLTYSDVPPVTHHLWNSLTTERKKELLDKKLFIFRSIQHGLQDDK